MASFDAISVVANTIRGVLANTRPERFEGAGFDLFRAENFQTGATRMSHGVSIYLHRIDFNTTRRNQPPRVTIDGKRFRPPTAVDLHFLITAWGRSTGEQMDILGWAIRTLQDTTELSAGLLNHFAGEQPKVFDDTEAVELVGEILTAQEIVNLWEIAKHNQQPSVSYVARHVLINSDAELPDAALVQSRGLGYVKTIINGNNSSTVR